MLAALYVKSWSVLRTVNAGYPPLFRPFGLFGREGLKTQFR
jgi:hypothetical protein